MTGSHEFDLSILPFKAPFRNWLVRDSKLVSYKLKCLSVGPAVYVFGVFVTWALNTSHYLIQDYPVLLATICMSVALCLLVYGCKQISPTISKLDDTVEHSKNSDFRKFVFEITNEGSWCRVRNRYWYHLQTAGLAVLLMVVACIGLTNPPPWITGVGRNVGWLSKGLYVFILGFCGYIAGQGFNLAMIYAGCINKYCTEFVKVDKVKLFPLDEAGGLKPLGKLALTINIASAIPVVYALAALYKTWIQEGFTVFDRPLYVVELIVYFAILALIFFYPIRPVHKVLARAKSEAREHLKLTVKQKYGPGVLDNLKEYETLNNLLLTYHTLGKAPTWPLDLRLSVGSIATILSPVIGGAILQIWFEFLFKLFVA